MDSTIFLKLFIIILFFSLFSRTTAGTFPKQFSFEKFKGMKSKIKLTGASQIDDDGVLVLTDSRPNVVGTAFYYHPMRLRSSVGVDSFSTSFLFSIQSSSSDRGGYGFAFTLSPTPNRPGSQSAYYLGLLNKSNNGNMSNHVFGVGFDIIGNQVGIIRNNVSYEAEEAVVYYDEDNKKHHFVLDSGKKIQATVQYNGVQKVLKVFVYPSELRGKLSKPLISQRIPQLSEIVKNNMYVGFTAATGNYFSNQKVYGWTFVNRTDVKARFKRFPQPDDKENTKRVLPRKRDYKIIALVGIVTSIMLVVALGTVVLYKKLKQKKCVAEEWETNQPHKFSYNDLYAATHGFRESLVIGVGGFGAVYLGTLPSSSDQIAVKKITPKSEQGIREFVAEIESLQRLRHKNIVNFRGWCKQKKDLLLVYDYIPNGSLSSLLYTRPRTDGLLLSWEMRFQIAKGIASGLLYLHEEGEQIVIHRDIKSSNVLLDMDMNARLSDFGLSRLYKPGTTFHSSKKYVGTTGYMAPELGYGNGSTASDVFALGIVLLELVTGTRPTDPRGFLPDWVMDLHSNGDSLNAVDEKLSSYDNEEARITLTTGLLCCYSDPASRPSIRTILRYLNREENVPEIDNNVHFSEPDFNLTFSESETGSLILNVASGSNIVSD